MPQTNTAATMEKKMAEERRKSRVPAKVPLTEINEYLMCQLCIGYLIDATAIIECQHTFCKSCILKYLETNSYCPICEVQLNEAKPNLSLRSDEILQKLVYKLVPGLVVTEVKRRKEFLEKFESDPPNDSTLLALEMKEAEDFYFLSPEDSVSLSLEYFKSTPSDEDNNANTANTNKTEAGSKSSGTTNPTADTSPSSPKKNTCSDKANDRRYLQCPAAVSVGLLKKFIRMKYGLSDDYRVDLLYNGDRDNNMENDLTLLDLAFIFKWKKSEPMCFHYRIFDRPPAKSASVRPGTKRPVPSMMDEPPPDDDAASGPTSRSSMMSASPSKLPRLGDSSGSSNATSTPKNNGGKGQGKKSSCSAETRTRTESVDSLEGSVFKSESNAKSGAEGSLNLRITTSTSPHGSVSSKLSPSSSSCSSSSSPPSPLKISLPLKAISEGKSSHHHRHHHRRHKEKKRHRSSKSKDKDREKGMDKESKYKYNAHPNPTQSQTISVKPGKIHNNVGKIVAAGGKGENSTAPQKETKDREIQRTKPNDSSGPKVIGVGANGGKNPGFNQRLSITCGSGGASKVSGNMISVSKVVERRNSATTPHVLSLINANSGTKSVVATMPEQRKPGRPSMASKLAAAAAAESGASSSSSPRSNNSLIPESVHLQVPKSVTLIPVSAPNNGSGGSKLISTTRVSTEKRISSAGMGTPHTFTHPITNKSLHQITVTEVPPPPKSASGSESNSTGASAGNFNGGSSSSSSIKSIEKSIQSLSSKQFNGPGSMEITKIYCDNKSSSGSASAGNPSSKVFETQGKKLKGLDISISSGPGSSNTSISKGTGGVGRKGENEGNQKLSLTLSKSLPKIPGVSILPQTNHLIAKQQQHHHQQKQNFVSGLPGLMSLSSKLNEKHSNRLSVSPLAQQGGKNSCGLPLGGGGAHASAFLRASTSTPPGDSSSFNQNNKRNCRSPPRKLGDALTATLVTARTPSPPHKASVGGSNHLQQKPKMKRGFETAFSRKSESPDSGGPSERKREKINSRTSSSEHDSPLDLSGKSSRSTPSPSESSLNSENSNSPTRTGPEPCSAAAAKAKGSGNRQGHTNLPKGQSHQLKNQSTSTTQTILSITQNLAQKQQQNAERHHQRQQQLMRSKPVNGSPPIASAGTEGFDQFGSLKTLTEMAVQARKIVNDNSLNCLIAASVAGFAAANSGQTVAGSGQSSQLPSPPNNASTQHLIPPHFGAHHHMNMSLMSPPQQRISPSMLLDTHHHQASTFFPNFNAGRITAIPATQPGKVRLVGSGSPNSPPLHTTTTPHGIHPFLAAARATNSTLRIPKPPNSKPNVKTSINSLFPSHAKSISGSSGSSSTLSSKTLTPISTSTGIRPTKINGNLVVAPSGPNTFVAPTSIIPISKAQTLTPAKSGIPNIMKISNFLPTTKSTSANANATITSSSSLSKNQGLVSTTPTPPHKFSIESIQGSAAGKSIISLTAATPSDKTISATYKLSSSPSKSSDNSTTAMPKSSSSVEKIGGTNPGSSSSSRLGDLGVALGLIPSEPPVHHHHHHPTQQQNQAVRHIPNPSQIFGRQSTTYTNNNKVSGASVNSNNTTTTLPTPQTLPPTPTATNPNAAKEEAKKAEKNSSSSSADLLAEVIKPGKPEPLPLVPLSSPEPPMASQTPLETQELISHQLPSTQREGKEEVSLPSSSLVVSEKEKETEEQKSSMEAKKLEKENLCEKDGSLVQTNAEGMDASSSSPMTIPPVVVSVPDVVTENNSKVVEKEAGGMVVEEKIQELVGQVEKEEKVTGLNSPETLKTNEDLEKGKEESGAAGEGTFEISPSVDCPLGIEMEEEQIEEKEMGDSSPANLMIEENVEEEEESNTQIQLSLEDLVTQVENKDEKMETLDSSPTQTPSKFEIKALIEIKEEKTQEEVPDTKPTIENINLSPMEPLMPTPDLTNKGIEGETMEALVHVVNPMEIKVEAGVEESVNPVPFIQIQQSVPEEKQTPSPLVLPSSSVPDISDASNSNASNPSSPTLSTLVINTNLTARTAEPPKSLLIPSPTPVALPSKSNPSSPSSIGLASPGSEKRIDLKKMENLEKVTAGLLASAASNINNNNNMIVTTTAASSTCDLSTSPARPSPTPITNV